MSTSTNHIAPPTGSDSDVDQPVVHRDRRDLVAPVAAAAVGGLLAAGITWILVTTVTLDLPMNALGL